MSSFTISDRDLDGIKGQVVIVTGASSGIGLATVKRLVQHGAKVFASDINDLPEPEKSEVPFMKVDVTSWKEQLDLFKAAQEKYGVIHHAFVNAGIGPTFNLLEDDKDENGDLLPPKMKTLDVNLTGVLYTVKLAVHYIKQNLAGGSIVMTGSGSSFSRFSPTDYTTSKHAVLGRLRSMYCNLSPELPIRINGIGPSWTETGIVSQSVIDTIGRDAIQSPDVVARSVLNLMAGPGKAHGEFIFSDRGKFWDLENGPRGLNAYARNMIGDEYVPEESAVEQLKARVRSSAAKAAGQ